MNNNSINQYNEDEIDLKQLFMSLIERRRFIVGVTGIVTLIAIGYLLLFASPSQYKVEVSFLKPSLNSVINLNQYSLLNETANTDESVFNKFLTNLNSSVLQKEVFIVGSYKEKLQKEGIEIGDVDKYIKGLTNSILITKVKESETTGVELPHILSTQSSNPGVLSEFLNEVLFTADSKTVAMLINLQQLKIATRLTLLTTKRSALLNEARQTRLNEIVSLKEAAAIANSLNIIDSNLNQFNKDSNNMNLNIAIQSGTNIPDWYLYGETTLLKMIAALESRMSDDAFIPTLIPINTEILKLESIRLDSAGIHAMQVYQAATSQILPTKKRLIVMIAFIGSFMLSLVLVLLMNVFKEEEVTSIQKGK